jgi:hypothetical protein
MKNLVKLIFLILFTTRPVNTFATEHLPIFEVSLNISFTYFELILLVFAFLIYFRRIKAKHFF